MRRRELTGHEREAVAARIEAVGKWLQRYEPPQTVTEDILGQQLRLMLGELRDAARMGRRSRVRKLLAQVEKKVLELWAARHARKKP